MLWISSWPQCVKRTAILQKQLFSLLSKVLFLIFNLRSSVYRSVLGLYCVHHCWLIVYFNVHNLLSIMQEQWLISICRVFIILLSDTGIWMRYLAVSLTLLSLTRWCLNEMVTIQRAFSNVFLFVIITLFQFEFHWSLSAWLDTCVAPRQLPEPMMTKISDIIWSH